MNARRVRIVGGTLAGTLVVPRDARVRPTADRVREAWMSILGPSIIGARVLDLFAGTGALGLEPLSRGAESATFVELTLRSLKALHANIESLGVADRVTVHRGDALRFAGRLETAAYDLVLADPPYTVDAAAIRRPLPPGSLRAHSFRRASGRANRWMGDETRRYGDTAITFCRSA